MRGTLVESVNSKNKSQIALLMIKPNTSEEVESFSLVVHQELDGVVPKELAPKVSLPLESVLEENTHEVVNDNYSKLSEDESSCDECIEIFNEFIRPTSANYHFGACPKICNNSYTFKKRSVLSTLGIFRPKRGI